MLVEVPFPDGSGKTLVTGLPIRMSATPTEIQRSFPAVGEHNEEIYCGLLGYSRKERESIKNEALELVRQADIARRLKEDPEYARTAAYREGLRWESSGEYARKLDQYARQAAR